MKPTSPSLLLLVALAAATLIALTSPAETQQRAPTVVNQWVQQPVWENIKIDDNTDSLLLKVWAGQRFVLTDMWFLSLEGEKIATTPKDRVWLESRHERERLIIFDSPLSELSLPLRWQTGVSIPGERELWINYKAEPATKVLRRVFFSGYLEADMPAASF